MRRRKQRVSAEEFMKTYKLRSLSVEDLFTLLAKSIDSWTPEEKLEVRIELLRGLMRMKIQTEMLQ